MEEMQDTWWDCSHYLYTTPQSQEKFLSFMNIEALKKKPAYFTGYIYVFRVVNVYYHCVVDANPRFKTSFFSGWKRIIHIWSSLERGIESSLAACINNYFSTESFSTGAPLKGHSTSDFMQIKLMWVQ